MSFDLIDTIIGLSFALFLTIAIELYIIKRFKLKSNKIIIIAFIVNVVTNVTMNLLLKFVFHENYFFWLGILEVAVFIIEAFAYNIVLNHYKQSFIVSLTCNSASLSVILVLNWIFSKNFLYIAFWWLMTTIIALIGSLFDYQDPGAITNIQIYTTDYIEIDGAYFQDYTFEDYDYNSNQHFTYRHQLNSPAPVNLFYTVSAEAFDSFIVRLTVDINDSNHMFSKLSIMNQTYYMQDLHDLTREGDTYHIDILYDTLSEPLEGYLLYNSIFVYLDTDESSDERIGIEIKNQPQTKGFCFFFGELDDLLLHKNESFH